MEKKDLKIIFSKTFVALYTLFQNQGIITTDWHFKTKIAYSHLYTIKDIMLREDWIEVKEEDKKYIYLTSKGMKICNQMLLLFNEMGLTLQDLNKLRERNDNDNEKDQCRKVENPI